VADIILHHYDRSPFSEKVRLVFGLKAISWRAVEIPAWAPKPDLMPLTGGYRRTPVMQIGADIYCDTRIILREIDRRFPKPSLYGAGGGELIAAWADSALFINAVGVAFGSVADSFPKELVEDREKFTGGRFSAARFKAAQPTLRAQYRAQLASIEETFADGRSYSLVRRHRLPILRSIIRCGLLAEMSEIWIFWKATPRCEPGGSVWTGSAMGRARRSTPRTRLGSPRVRSLPASRRAHTKTRAAAGWANT
jgi:glutathione S-transferase